MTASPPREPKSAAPRLRSRVPRRRLRAAERDSTVYRDRLVRGHELGLSRAQASGHARDAGERAPGRFFGERHWTVTFPTTGGELETVRVSRRDAVRAGRYDRMLADLRDGRISPEEFRRRASRMAPIGGRRVLSDPDQALVMVATAEPEEWVFESARVRGRRGR